MRMLMHVTNGFRRSLRGERGLKFGMDPQCIRSQARRSLRGERGLKYFRDRSGDRPCCRSLRGERGLK